MVSKITIFEPHFDGAQFGPTSIVGDESSPETTGSATADPDVEGSRRGSRLLAMVALGGLATVLFVGVMALRRRRSTDSMQDVEAVDVEERPVEAPATE